MTFENYHLVDFMKQTHYAFLHEKNVYHSRDVLEYQSNKHGVDFIGKMWHAGKDSKDPVMTYKRLTSIEKAGWRCTQRHPVLMVGCKWCAYLTLDT